jgi:hypothetical protein
VDLTDFACVYVAAARPDGSGAEKPLENELPEPKELNGAISGQCLGDVLWFSFVLG